MPCDYSRRESIRRDLQVHGVGKRRDRLCPPRDGGLQPREALTHAMKTPKTVTATKFKTHCLTLLEEVRQTHHGKPVAEISPYTPKSSEQLNSLKGSVLFEGDIISPLEEKWDCEL